MSASEKIVIVEEVVAGLQNHLGTAESVLETAEQIAVEGERTGRCLKRLVHVLLVLSIVAIAVGIIKKVAADGCRMGKKAVDDREETPDPVVTESDRDASADSAVSPDGDSDTA